MSDTFTYTGKFWEGPLKVGDKGHYIERTFTVSKKNWRNSMSREYAERHGFIKKYKLK